jgi:hypothetical protein
MHIQLITIMSDDCLIKCSNECSDNEHPFCCWCHKYFNAIQYGYTRSIPVSKTTMWFVAQLLQEIKLSETNYEKNIMNNDIPRFNHITSVARTAEAAKQHSLS